MPIGHRMTTKELRARRAARKEARKPKPFRPPAKPDPPTDRKAFDAS